MRKFVRPSIVRGKGVTETRVSPAIAKQPMQTQTAPWLQRVSSRSISIRITYVCRT